MKDATFTVVLKNGQPWLEWVQYETEYLRIWKAKSDRPYVRYMGATFELDSHMIEQLRNLM